jgi:FeS assembly SUF system protein
MMKPEQETAPQPAAPEAATAAVTDPSDIENGIVEALKTVYDPEIPVNIYELGLIYDVDIQEDGAVKVKMTLTAPGCPVAGTLPGEVQAKVAGAPGVTSADVELVWDPAWNPSMMSEAARLELGMF